MNIDLNFDAKSFTNETLRNIGVFVTNQASGGETPHLTRLIADGRVRLVSGVVEQTGKNGWFLRSSRDEKTNDEMRDIFVDALSKEFGIEGLDGQARLARLQQLFGADIFKFEDYGKGRPLTMRRITHVLNKIDDVKWSLRLECMHAASRRLGPCTDELKEIVCAAAKALKATDKTENSVLVAFRRQVSTFVGFARTGSATTFDLEALCFAALEHVRAGAVSAEAVKSLADRLRAQIGENLDRMNELAMEIKQDAELCLDVRANFNGDNFASRYTRVDAEAQMAKFRNLGDVDDAKCRKYTLINLEIRNALEELKLEEAEHSRYIRTRLRGFGVSDADAKKFWSIGDLNALETVVEQKTDSTSAGVLKMIDDKLSPALGLLLGRPETDGETVKFLAKLRAECPVCGKELEAFGRRVKEAADALTNLGTILSDRVEKALPTLSTDCKLAAVARMARSVRERLGQMVGRGETDFVKVIGEVEVPSAESLANPTVEDQMEAFKVMLLKYREEFSDARGNSNNENGFQSRVRSKLEAILTTLDKVVSMSAVKSDVLAKLEAAKVCVKGDYKKPCNKTEPGREAVKMIETAMGGVGAHGDANAPGEMGFAVDMFCKVPELFRHALEEDRKRGNDESFRFLCEALNTDGCVQAYAESINAVNDKFNGFEEVVDLGPKGDGKLSIDVLVGRVFPTLFKNVGEANHIAFTDFAARLARYLADRAYGTYEERLQEITANKNDRLAFLSDFGVDFTR